MEFFSVAEHTCNRDGICAAVCPAGVIEFAPGEFPRLTDDGEKRCIQCGHCVAACPTDSITHREVPLDKSPPIREELRISAEQCEQFLRARRSIRAYKDTPVPREVIQTLIETARYAPTGSNSQTAQWLVLDDKGTLRDLSAGVADWMRAAIRDNPDAKGSSGMARTVERYDSGYDVYLRDAPALVIAHAHRDDRAAPASCTIALTYLELAATAVGIGPCWAGYFNGAANSFAPLQKKLPLPEGHRCFGALMIGYPKYKYRRLVLRRPPAISWG